MTAKTCFDCGAQPGGSSVRNCAAAFGTFGTPSASIE
jgi:hypothetical protein